MLTIYDACDCSKYAYLDSPLTTGGLNLASPIPFDFALAVHSASPLAQLDSFSSLDAVYLVASLARTQIAVTALTLALVHRLRQSRCTVYILRASLRV
jgi:hypothetical protein